MGRKHQTALVTGASSGIGRETAIRLAESGYDVIVAARRLERLQELAKRYSRLTPRQVDLSEPKDTEAFCQYLEGLKVPVSVLINNAGYATRGVLEDVALKDIRRLYEVNLFALIRVTQACLPGMRKQRSGTVINVSSIVGKFPFAGSGVYASSKYAVEGITDALRVELAPYGIKVVAIRPGAIATEFGQVAEKMTGDLMARTDPDYQSFYQTAKAAVDKLFAERTISTPDLIADLIMEAVQAKEPKAVYAGGTLSKTFLGKRKDLGDNEFHQFLIETFGLTGLQF